MSTPADQLCASVNEHLTSLDFSYTEGDSEQSLAIAGRPPIRFPLDAGGKVGGGSAAWVHKKHQGGAIHEPGMIATLLALSEERPSISTIFDIGALYGYVSFVARSLFEHAEVHAFEANPRSYRALRGNLRANRATFKRSVRSHNVALSDTSRPHAPVRIHQMRVDELGSGDRTEGTGKEVEIDVWSLDDYCREHALAPDLIKLDVEGYQAKIIPGASEVIARCRPVILLEFDAPGAANDFGITNREVIKPLMADGYQLVWGEHRSVHKTFRVLDHSELTDEHEINSLGILVP